MGDRDRDRDRDRTSRDRNRDRDRDNVNKRSGQDIRAGLMDLVPGTRHKEDVQVGNDTIVSRDDMTIRSLPDEPTQSRNAMSTSRARQRLYDLLDSPPMSPPTQPTTHSPALSGSERRRGARDDSAPGCSVFYWLPRGLLTVLKSQETRQDNEKAATATASRQWKAQDSSRRQRH